MASVTPLEWADITRNTPAGAYRSLLSMVRRGEAKMLEKPFRWRNRQGNWHERLKTRFEVEPKQVALHGLKATVQYAGTFNGHKHWWPTLRWSSGMLSRADGIKYNHKGRALRVAQRVVKEMQHG